MDRNKIKLVISNNLLLQIIKKILNNNICQEKVDIQIHFKNALKRKYLTMCCSGYLCRQHKSHLVSGISADLDNLNI